MKTGQGASMARPGRTRGGENDLAPNPGTLNDRDGAAALKVEAQDESHREAWRPEKCRPVKFAMGTETVSRSNARPAPKERKVIEMSTIAEHEKQQGEEIRKLRAERDAWRQTLRDQFAMAALTALLSRSDVDIQSQEAKVVAEAAYGNADAMLEARTPSQERPET